MMTPEQARRMAEEALSNCTLYPTISDGVLVKRSVAIEAIAAALVKLTQGQRPVAYLETITGQVRLPDDEHRLRFPKAYVPLYTHPIPSQQEERKPLTKGQIWGSDEIMAANGEFSKLPMKGLVAVVRAVEAAHNIKEQK